MSIHKMTMTRSSGFYSDVLTLVNGILYCHDQGCDWWIDWRNWRYSTDDANLFDRYFWQVDRSAGPFDETHESHLPKVDSFTPYGAFFPQYSGLTEDQICEFLFKPAQIMAQYKVFDNPAFMNVSKDFFGGQKVLGFHKRGTDHHAHGPITSNDTWVKNVRAELEREHFDKVFCITDEQTACDHFQKEFGDMFMCTDSFKSNDGWAIHGGASAHAHYDTNKLGGEIIRDSVLLSMCDKQMFARSNVGTFIVLYDLRDPSFDRSRIKFVDNHLEFHN